MADEIPLPEIAPLEKDPHAWMAREEGALQRSITLPERPDDNMGPCPVFVDGEEKARELTCVDDEKTQEELPDPRGRKNVNGELVELTEEERGSVLLGGHFYVSRANLSSDQGVAYDQIHQWWKDDCPSPIISLGGYAGTGKSTLVATFAEELIELDLKVAFCCYTGKATNVLKRKLEANKALKDLRYSCTTIHSLMKTAIIHRETGEMLGFRQKDEIAADIIIVDEASMIPSTLFEELQSYGIPILAVGDHGQLPPIADKGWGKNADKPSIMLNPDVRLEKIHRQAEGNPIIDLSARIRHHEPLYSLPFDGILTKRMQAVDSSTEEILRQFFRRPSDADKTAVLCGFNHTRCKLNKAIQTHLGFAPKPGDPPIQPGDRVICLRNSYFDGDGFLANGTRGAVDTVRWDGEHHLEASIVHQEDNCRLNGRLSPYQFGRSKTFGKYEELPFEVKKWDDVGLLFDLGYAMTCHKSQGSQYPRVVVFVEKFGRSSEDDFRRWLYTAVTRAESELVLVF